MNVETGDSRYNILESGEALYFRCKTDRKYRPNTCSSLGLMCYRYVDETALIHETRRYKCLRLSVVKMTSHVGEIPWTRLLLHCFSRCCWQLRITLILPGVCIFMVPLNVSVSTVCSLLNAFPNLVTQFVKIENLQKRMFRTCLDRYNAWTIRLLSY